MGSSGRLVLIEKGLDFNESQADQSTKVPLFLLKSTFFLIFNDDYEVDALARSLWMLASS